MLVSIFGSGKQPLNPLRRVEAGVTYVERRTLRSPRDIAILALKRPSGSQTRAESVPLRRSGWLGKRRKAGAINRFLMPDQQFADATLL